MMISGMKKYRDIRLGLQGGDKGCSYKYDGTLMRKSRSIFKKKEQTVVMKGKGMS